MILSKRRRASFPRPPSSPGLRPGWNLSTLRGTSAPFAGWGTTARRRRKSREYLPRGPFSNEEALRDQLRQFATALNREFYAVCDPVTGKATFLDVRPSAGVIEIGGIWFAPAFLRTRSVTEAMSLMLAYV